MCSMCLNTTYFSILLVLTSSLTAPLPRDCVPGICPKVDSDEWTRLQSRCCTDHNVYHCQVGNDARVQAVCSKVRHCDASQAVVVTSVGVECRQCLKGVSGQVPSPSYYHTRLSKECETVGGIGDETQQFHHMGHEDSPASGQGRANGRPHPNTKPFHKDASGKKQIAKNSNLSQAKYQAEKASSAKTLSNDIPSSDSSRKTDHSEATWSIVLIAVAMAALTLILLGVMVFFVIKYFARRVSQVYSIGGCLSSEIQYKHI